MRYSIGDFVCYNGWLQCRIVQLTAIGYFVATAIGFEVFATDSQLRFVR